MDNAAFQHADRYASVIKIFPIIKYALDQGVCIAANRAGRNLKVLFSFGKYEPSRGSLGQNLWSVFQ